jgi:pimeloyl-ACP methyl ester carboxylesterase
MVEDVVRLMDHLHIGKAHVVGYSMGGMIAMKLVTLHPERVSSVVLGGMGWLKENSSFQHYWQAIREPDHPKVPGACLRGFSELAVTEQAVKSVGVQVDIVVGDRDPCRRLYVEPLRQLRPDWPVHVIKAAGHINCVLKPEFKEQVRGAVNSRAGSRMK